MKEEIISVGIDIGTSTTQLVFTKIVMENISSEQGYQKLKLFLRKYFIEVKYFLHHLKVKLNDKRQ